MEELDFTPSIHPSRDKRKGIKSDYKWPLPPALAPPAQALSGFALQYLRWKLAIWYPVDTPFFEVLTLIHGSITSKPPQILHSYIFFLFAFFSSCLPFILLLLLLLFLRKSIRSWRGKWNWSHIPVSKQIVIKRVWYWHKDNITEQWNRKPRNNSTHIWSTDLWKGYQEYTVGKW